jgi:prevent-host-death family protein
MARTTEEDAMQVTVHAAKTHLSKLIEAALSGEEVVIARGRKPVVRLVPIPQGRFKIGLLQRELSGPGPDFLEPLEENELTPWEGE